MKRIVWMSVFSLICLTVFMLRSEEEIQVVPEPQPVTEEEMAREPKIQVAILLDTSGSMQGLIEQAKSRLWNIVNTLTTLKFHGQEPRIEIALYEYGSFHRYEGDYIRQITGFTSDLDLISEELFSLTTGGSEEFCGTVISRASKELEWGRNKNDMKIIYIAGNEVFEQGRISYKKAIPQAVEKDIYVNTIHCGNRSAGIRDQWKRAADLGQGKFFNIDHNAAVRWLETPFDNRLNELNLNLNNTYIYYGSQGEHYKMNQARQDKNALSLSSANFAERVVSKSKSVYRNTSWDLVDKWKEDQNALSKIKKEELPAELQQKSVAELEAYVQELQKEREAIQKEIASLAHKRQEYIDGKQQTKIGQGDDLGHAITVSIQAIAKTKGFEEEND